MVRRVNLERWQPHVEEARRRGVTLKAYAAEQGLSLYSLYRASQVMGEASEQPARAAKRAQRRFAAVRVVPAVALPLRVAAQWRVAAGGDLRERRRSRDCRLRCAAMFRLNPGVAVWLHRDAIDFRKNIDGLAALVQHELGLDPFAAAVYVFANRRRNRVKILGWERNGFWLLQKRLEQQRFAWPRGDAAVVELTAQQLHWLLDGIDLAAMRGHREVKVLRAA